ncbi:MAG: flp pilus-assembly TadE/G-like family protein [Cellulomonadaceae bacterium]|jgi:secretion/DNA translocation related TadE-like protein|nr:flp pilus-assembly TadE/G-like family protein [Cellulomonadaceae bacterium]
MTGLTDGERGSGTVLNLALGMVAVICMTALAALGAASRAQGLAQTAADLGALAAATAIQVGADPCAVAADVVQYNMAVLVACTVEAAGVVTVETARDVDLGMTWGTGTATARARAGPQRSQ